jgi:radical SAM superfamily enzyme YgiQ (UPF0313 family)
MSTPIALAPPPRQDRWRPVDVAVVALPFYTQYSACLPAMLLREIIEAAGDTAQVVYSHIDFPLRFIRDQADHDLYKRFAHEGYLADLVLLPLFEGWRNGMAAELDDFAARIDAPDDAFRRRFRDAFDSHLQAVAERLADTAVVALTATHYQLVPSLLLAERLRRLYGDGRPRIVLGGYFGSVENAEGVLAAHPEIDCVVYGEAEDVWPQVRAALDGGERRFVRGGARAFTSYLPRHDDVLDRVAAIPWFARRFQATFELSRGCYWDKCDFCNFNASYDAVFKSHPPARVLGEMDRLHRVYGQDRFQFTDTAVPKKLTRALREDRTVRDWSVFMELRPDFDFDDFAALTRLGTIRAQIGIESLVESHLARMNKNATVGDNVRSLLICQQLDIVPTWGFLLEHPEETVAELEQTLSRARSWIHLPPPRYVDRCEIRAGSPLSEQHAHARPQTSCRPYELILASSEKAYDLIPYPLAPPPDAAQRRALLAAVDEAVTDWRTAYAAGARLVGRPAGDGTLRVDDSRSGSLRGRTLDRYASTALLTAAESGATVPVVAAAAALPEPRAAEVLDELVGQGLGFWSRSRRGNDPVFEALVGGLHELRRRGTAARR